MDKLETLICDSVGKAYNCIRDGDAVIAPCYLITPYGVGTLKGNGTCVGQTLQCEVCFFVESREKAFDIATQLNCIFLKNQYVCSDPGIEYEKNAKAWKVIFLVEYVIERN